jgi:hypothetical protein
LAPLERDLRGVFTFPVHIAVALGAMPEKGSRAKISATVKDWLITNEPAIRDGEAKENFHIPGVPFGIDVARLSDGPPELILGRLTSPDASLTDRVKVQLSDKADKLKKYKADGFHTILLVECPDLARMSDGMMARAVKEAFAPGRPSSVDRVWFARTAFPWTAFVDITPT